MMRDLSSPAVLYLKGGLLLLLGMVAAGLVLLESPSLRTVLLLAITIWAFCRAYYFAFYVVQHYIDPGYRYAGLFHFFRHLLSRWRARPPR